MYKECCNCFYFQAHMEVCRYDTIPCPNQCSDVLSRLSLDDHLEFSCPKRIVICEFCNQEFPGEAFDLVNISSKFYFILFLSYWHSIEKLMEKNWPCSLLIGCLKYWILIFISLLTLMKMSVKNKSYWFLTDV